MSTQRARPLVSRRRFLAGISALFLGLPGWPLPALGSMTKLAAAQREWLLKVLPRTDRTYDPFAKMLVTSARNGPGYHSTLKSGDVHSTHLSLIYAGALLDTGERWRTDRARDILQAVLNLQDRNPESATYGLWPWYLEEALTRMSPPDWNWADLCGSTLLMTWTAHREFLGTELAELLRDAIFHAARSIQRRNVSFDETSIAIMGTGVTLVAAQEMKLREMRGYARDRLRRLYEQVMRQGSFTEYNSPSHSIVALGELSRMLLLVKDARDRALISALHDAAWKHVATHFHAPSQQWAGPQSRADASNLASRAATLAFLQKACAGRASLHWADPQALGLDAYRLPLQCPRKWVRHFAQLEGPSQVIETFVRADPARPGAKNPVIGTTWLHPRFALGSVNRGDFWKKRRPFLAHWGTAAAPRFLQARFLKNGDDFSSALLFSAQSEANALAIVVFAVDNGDAHPAFDPIPDGRIRARDLRLTFDLGGALGRCTIRGSSDEPKSILIRDEEVRFVLRPVAGTFGDAAFQWDQPDLKLAEPISAVAYRGEEKTFDLPSLGEIFVCFTLSEWPYDRPQSPATPVELQRADGKVHARWPVDGKTLELEVPIRPAPVALLNDALRGGVA